MWVLLEDPNWGQEEESLDFPVKSKFRIEMRCLEMNNTACSILGGLCPVPTMLPLSTFCDLPWEC